MGASAFSKLPQFGAKYDSFRHCLPRAGTSGREHRLWCLTHGVQLTTTLLGSVTSLLLWPRTQDDHYRSGTRCLENAWERSLAKTRFTVPLGLGSQKGRLGTHSVSSPAAKPHETGALSHPPRFLPTAGLQPCGATPTAGKHPPQQFPAVSKMVTCARDPAAWAAASLTAAQRL